VKTPTSIARRTPMAAAKSVMKRPCSGEICIRAISSGARGLAQRGERRVLAARGELDEVGRVLGIDGM
jgi:hypothetical protein